MPEYTEDVMLDDKPGLADRIVADPSETVELLLLLQDKLDSDFASFESDLDALEREHSADVYSDLIYLLSHLRFDAGEARRHWERIREHRDAMKTRLGQSVDLRVALISYFLEVNRQLENPKIIEMKLFERTQASADRDGLTGLYNYRVFTEHLNREIYRGERNGWPLSVIMLDVDAFKAFNDRHGHEAGNEALRQIASLIEGVLRKGDIPARYGGEEFAVILPSTPKTNATEIAERMRRSIEQHGFPEGRKLTVSLGVATLPADARETDEVIRRADQALYVSKAGGRNQVTPYGRSRRSFPRVDAQLQGSLRQVSDEAVPLTTADVSEAGLSIRVDRRLAHGSLVEIRLDLAGSEVVLAARVIGVEATSGGQFRTAVQFKDISTRDRNRLLTYLRSSRAESD